MPLHDTDIPLQELDSTTDHRTFGEIEADEKAQWDRIHTQLKEHRFESKRQANEFKFACCLHTLRRLGVKLKYIKRPPEIYLVGRHCGEDIEKCLYRLYRVRISKHTRGQEDEIWQAGTYIYQKDELVAFVSAANHFKSEIIMTVPYWLVRTNVELPGGKGKIIV